jgi:hypothetical protein
LVAVKTIITKLAHGYMKVLEEEDGILAIYVDTLVIPS